MNRFVFPPSRIESRHVEILSHLINYCSTDSRSQDIASQLIHHFGSFASVLESSEADLMQFTTPKAASLLSSLVSVFQIYERDCCQDGLKVMNYKDLIRYCHSLFLGENNEQSYVLCFDSRLHLLSCSLIGVGTPSAVPLIPRIAVEELMRAHASTAIITHNHPSGNPSPSSEDIEVTMELQHILSMLEIRLFDHIIIANNASFSFRKHRLLD